MNGPMRKDLFRSIIKGFTRFLCIVLIIALGISFFVGMKSASPDMRKTACEYYIERNLMDIRVTSSIGFTSDEVKKIAAVEGVHSADAVKCVDTLVFSGEYGISNAMNGSAMACRVMSLDFDRAGKYSDSGEADESYINRVELVDGRYPKNKNECVVDSAAAQAYSQLSVDSVISLQGDETSLNGILNTNNFKIVGTVESPEYCSYERGITTIGSGSLGMFLYISDECFVSENYDVVFATVDGKDKYDVYSDEYKSFVREIGEKIDSISADSISSRIKYVEADYKSQLDKYKNTYKKLEKQTKEKLEDALDDINKVQHYIDTGASDIAKDKKNLDARVKSAESNFASSKKAYDRSKKEYEKDKSEANDKGNELNGYKQGKKIYDDYLKKQQADRKEIDGLISDLALLEDERGAKKDAYEQAVSDYDSAVRKVQEKEEELSEAKKKLQENKDRLAAWTEESLVSKETLQRLVRESNAKCTRISKELDTLKNNASSAENAKNNAKSEYDTAKEKCSDMQKTIESREQTYSRNQEILNGYADDVRRLKEGEEALTIFKRSISETGRNLIAAKIALTQSQLKLHYEESTGNKKITTEEASLKAAKTRLEKAEKRYASVEHDTKLQLKQAQGDIDHINTLLDELNSSVWSVSYQTDLPGFTGYEQSLKNINEFSIIFPVIFFVIAAFVFLATMTRMVQEERMQMGTLKALGYSTGRIVKKYYAYALIAGITGTIIGSIAGSFILPEAIDSAYSMIFNMPSVKTDFNMTYIGLGAIVAVILSLVVTSIACRRELKVQAAHLMRPKAPVAGKKIFLERFTTLWESISFGSVVTLRNMFRSKKRMIVTVIGVAGCTALILTAFGLNNSIDGIITSQYGDKGLIKYNINLSLDEAQVPGESEIVKDISKDVRVDRTMLVHSNTVTASLNGKSIALNVVVPSDTQKFSNYVDIHQRKSKSGMIPGDDGAIISEKAAEELGISPGDTVKMKTVSGKEISVPVRDTCENYLDHYIYFSPEKFEQVFGEAPEYKNILIKLQSYTTGGDEQTLADDLFAYNQVTGVSTSDIRINTYNSVIDRLDAITVIFIVAAGFLALIVLYNLTSISIQERQREIATVSVLGFNDLELAIYVYRENIVFTVAGIILGLVGGVIIHSYIINLAEVDIAMFGRRIFWWSYIAAALITSVFAATVFAVIFRKMQKFDTLSALKSVE